MKDVKDAVRQTWFVSSGALDGRFPGGHPVLPWLVKYSAAMVNRRRRGPDGKTAYELRKGRKFARALPHLAEKILFMIPGPRKESQVLNQEGRTESSLVCPTGVTSSTWDRERHAQGSNTRASRDYRTSQLDFPACCVGKTLGRLQQCERRASCVA